MRVSTEIRRALEKKGLRSLKQASQATQLSCEILRLVLNKGHIPKDKTLRLVADKLGLDAAALILAAHQEKMASNARGHFLTPVKSPYSEGKRKYPLSQEQCDYLGKIMSPVEIQLVRKSRQVTPEAKVQIMGYVDYIFGTCRQCMQNELNPTA